MHVTAGRPAYKEGRAMLTLTNDFHRTYYRTCKSRTEVTGILDTEPTQRTAAERSWVARVARRLCGIHGCICGRNEIYER